MLVLYASARLLGPGGRVVSGRAFAVADGWIAWIGSGSGSDVSRRVSRRVSLGGRLVTPGFVDAHVHLTPTGLTLAGLHLAGVRSVRDVRASLERFAARERGSFVWGTGWDDAGWRGRGPAGADLDAVAGDRFVYLSRVDGHSAVVSSRLFDAARCARHEGADVGARGRFTGVVRREAHHAARRYVLDNVPASRLAEAQAAAAERAASVGITTVHEMGGPHITAGERDLDVLLGQRERLPVDVVPYYASEDLRVVLSRGLRQVGGDLNVDGALGSRTAALDRPYADQRGQRGFLYRDAGDCAEFFEAATRAGLQAGVHCIGEAACEAAVRGLERAARRAGVAVVRRLRHRLEHFEMASRELIVRAGRLGAALSMQPAFDAAWGGDGGMYAMRVGKARARRMNDFRAIVRAGCVCGFGSDSPVTPLDPLGGVRAAASPSVPSHALPPAVAFRLATLGGSALAREERVKGRLAVGYRADFVVWDGDPLGGAASVAATVRAGRVTFGSI